MTNWYEIDGNLVNLAHVRRITPDGEVLNVVYTDSQTERYMLMTAAGCRREYRKMVAALTKDKKPTTIKDIEQESGYEKT